MTYRQVEQLEDAVIAAARNVLNGGPLDELATAVGALGDYEDELAQSKERSKLVRRLSARVKESLPLVPVKPKAAACNSFWRCTRAGGWTFDGGKAYCKQHADKACDAEVSRRIRDAFAVDGVKVEWYRTSEVPAEATRRVAEKLGVSLDDA